MLGTSTQLGTSTNANSSQKQADVVSDCDEERRQRDEGARSEGGAREQHGLIRRQRSDKRNQIVVDVPPSFYSPSSKREWVGGWSRETGRER